MSMRGMDKESTESFFWGVGCAFLNLIALLIMRSVTTGDLRMQLGFAALLMPIWIAYCGAVAFAVIKMRRLASGPSRLVIGTTLLGVGYAIEPTPLTWLIRLVPEFAGIGLLLSTLFHGASKKSMRMGAIAAGYLYFTLCPFNVSVAESRVEVFPHRHLMALPMSLLLLCTVPPSSRP